THRAPGVTGAKETGSHDPLKNMVLPERIELSTSPLPRGCSTTELRQRCFGSWASGRGYTRLRRLATRAARCAVDIEAAGPLPSPRWPTPHAAPPPAVMPMPPAARVLPG